MAEGNAGGERERDEGTKGERECVGGRDRPGGETKTQRKGGTEGEKI